MNVGDVFDIVRVSVIVYCEGDGLRGGEGGPSCETEV